MKPDVTIIIPTYNRLWSLPKALASCRQAGLETEIIVVDDGSTDGTWEWLQNQQGIIALHQENRGKYCAVNRAVSIAAGKYVRFLDSDDWYHEGTLRAQFLLAEETQADVVVGGHSVWLDEKTQIESQGWTYCSDFIAQQLGECPSSHYGAYLFSKSFIADIQHRPEFWALDDRLFVLEVALRFPKVAVYDAPVVALRHHDQPRLQFQKGMRAVLINYQHLQIYRRILRQLDEKKILSMRHKKAAIKVLWPLAHNIAYTHLDEACEVVNWIHAMDPDFVPPDPGMLGYLYRTWGFGTTEVLLRVRRRALSFLRSFGFIYKPIVQAGR